MIKKLLSLSKAGGLGYPFPFHILFSKALLVLGYTWECFWLRCTESLTDDIS